MNANHQEPQQDQDRPNEIPEKNESEHEQSGYPHEIEQEQQKDGSDTSYSEQTGVTPPNQKEFPSVQDAKTNFASRK